MPKRKTFKISLPKCKRIKNHEYQSETSNEIRLWSGDRWACIHNIYNNLCKVCYPIKPETKPMKRRDFNDIPIREERFEGKTYLIEGEPNIWKNNRWWCQHEHIKEQCLICQGNADRLLIPKADRQIDEIYSVKGQVRKWGYDGKKLSWLCIHGTRPSRCKQEGCIASGICCHGSQKYHCRQCSPASFCVHNRRKDSCKDCQSTSYCVHQRRRYYCRECSPSTFCIHNKLKCRVCTPSSFCIHDVQMNKCGECNPTIMCMHNRNKHQCITCESSITCQLCRYSCYRTKFKPYCSTCFYYLNPDVPQTRNYLTKQKQLKKWLDENIEQSYEYDRIIEGGCSKRRPDFFFDLGTHTVHIENDENRHIGTQCEDRRTMEIFRDLGSRPLVQIRFNPDSYVDEQGVRQPSCFSFNKNKHLILNDQLWLKRMSVLKESLLFHLSTIPDKELSVVYLFYGQQSNDSKSESDEDELVINSDCTDFDSVC